MKGNDTVTIYNYVGEVNDEATFQLTVLRGVHVNYVKGVTRTINGDTVTDKISLLVFHKDFERQKPYMPYKAWLALEDKSPYWTLSPKDKIVLGESAYAIPYGTIKGLESVYECFEITNIAPYTKGSKSLWHIEVGGA